MKCYDDRFARLAEDFNQKGLNYRVSFMFSLTSLNPLVSLFTTLCISSWKRRNDNADGSRGTPAEAQQGGQDPRTGSGSPPPAGSNGVSRVRRSILSQFWHFSSFIVLTGWAPGARGFSNLSHSLDMAGNSNEKETCNRLLFYTTYSSLTAFYLK